jgi:hypothetical protein
MESFGSPSGEVVLRRTAPELVPSRVFAKEYERAAKPSALGNAVDHVQNHVDVIQPRQHDPAARL